MNLSKLETLLQEAATKAVAEAAGSPLPTPEYLNTRQAAHYLGLSHQYLEIARHKGKGPPYTRLARAIRYRKTALDAWMASRERNPELVEG